MGERPSVAIFVDDYLAALDIPQQDYQTFCRNKILPALLKNHKRLPDKTRELLQQQLDATDALPATACE
jgi:hypothetical protein